ncbi:MAG: hypothetical protein ACRDGA_06125 [Bacteroidota bacterium]
MKRESGKIFWSLLTSIVFATETIAACPVCYADPNSPTSNALTYAIVVLLGVTGSVLGGFVGFFFYLRRRANKMTLNGTVDYPSLN